MNQLDLSHIKDEDLFKTRICDLGLRIEGTDLEKRIQTLFQELDEKKVVFRPTCYLGDEWFSPDDEPTIAIPFYLAHSRLIKLEQTMMLEAEGSTAEWCMRLLRHETGHAITHAYRLDRKKSWQKVFGNPKQKYDPDTYKPRPYSRSFVVNLENWYAQSHPHEDFAETFAVWLNPEIDWGKNYKGWKALKKIEFIDKLMKQISQKKPFATKGKKICEASRLKQKLQTYYQRKRALYQEEYPDFFDRDLKKIFSNDEQFNKNEKATKFIAQNRKALINVLAKWSKAKKYTLNKLLKNFMSRCHTLNLRLCKDEQESLLQITVYLTTLATNYLYTGKFKKSP